MLARLATLAPRHQSKLLPRTAGCIRRYTAPLKDLRFCINEVHEFQKHYDQLYPDNEMVAPETLEMVLEEVAKFCELELAPLNETADAEGCTYVDAHTVKTPSGFKEAYDQFVEGGWQGLSYPPEFGGQGLPYSYSVFQADMMAAANWTWTMYPGLSKGAINTILAHCSQDLQQAYLQCLNLKRLYILPPAM